MRKLLSVLAVGVAAVSWAGSAQAVVTVTSTDYGFGANPAGVLIDFDAPTPVGFTLTGSGYAIVNGDVSGIAAAPAISMTADDTTDYLAVGGATGAVITSLSKFFQAVSLYWGSIDDYNTINLFNGSTLVGTINSTTPGTGGEGGNQTLGATNRRVNIFSTVAFNSVQFQSGQAAFELDNVVLGSAVPEAGTWLMMLAGFGVMGFAMRRRPQTSVTFG